MTAILILLPSLDWILLDILSYDKIASGKNAEEDKPLKIARAQGYIVEEIYNGVPRFQFDCFKRFMRAEYAKLKILGEEPI